MLFLALRCVDMILAFCLIFLFLVVENIPLVAMQAACTSYGLGLLSCTFLWGEALDLSAEAVFLSAKWFQCANGVRGT